MGCDIHLFVEARKSENDPWESQDVWTKDEFTEGQLTVDREDAWYSDRCYSLFAILADVRNGFGFAGIPTGNPVIPISQPRGLPSDCNNLVKQEHSSWGLNAHSESYLSVRELLEFDWAQKTERFGVMKPDIYEAWNRWGRKRGESPKDYCAGVSGPNVVVVNEDEAQERLKEAKNKDNLYIRASWEQQHSVSCSSFWIRTMPRLIQLGNKFGNDNARIVFWFDN